MVFKYIFIDCVIITGLIYRFVDCNLHSPKLKSNSNIKMVFLFRLYVSQYFDVHVFTYEHTFHLRCLTNSLSLAGPSFRAV
jgi:hypothetical protein